MLGYYWLVAIAMTIVIPGIVALVRFKKISAIFHPFLFCIWAGFIAESLNVILAHTIRNSWVSINIFLLVEVLLYTWQFRRWGLYVNRSMYAMIMLGTIAAWVVQVAILSAPDQASLHFPILSAMVIVLQAISQMNAVLVREKGDLLHSPVFLICSAFAVYFTLRVVVSVSWLYGDQINPDFARFIFMSLNYVNLLANFIFALAILWMPARQRFLLPS